MDKMINRLELLLITGSYPPKICGVGDYTNRLISATTASNWQLYYSEQWTWNSFFYHVRAINRTGKRIINMQYPTQGYGWSIIPHLLCIYYSWFTRKRFSITVHEQSQLSFKAKVAEFFILLTANRVIFTNEFERSYALKRIPFMKRRSTVIKIYSNITPCVSIKPMEEREYDLINFGHIRPNKGIEYFIDTVSSLTATYKVAIVGQVPEGFEIYYKKIAQRCCELNIDIILGLSDQSVSALLNNTKIVYLPFPDGASERRGSLLAAFANGATVVTTVGPFTTNPLRKAIIDSREKPLSDILSNTELLRMKQREALNFIRTEIPAGWEDIAQQYNTFLK